MNPLERTRGALRPRGYDPGDKVSALIKDANGVERRVDFEIEAFCGGGFAGQVYRARCITAEQDWLPVGQRYALKFFSPRSGFRRLFRDILYRLCFISPFAYQYNEDSVRAGLFLTKLLQIACRVELGTDRPINEFYGTFWDDHVGSFAELNEWVEGGVTEPSVDNEIFVRYSRNRRMQKAPHQGETNQCQCQQAQNEMAKKKRFMAFLCRLCASLGFDDIARQVYWWTGVSQPNVLTRRNVANQDDEPDFVWVDRRPGLPGLILSFGDIPLLAKAICRGSIPPFDRINFRKLRAWAKAPDRKEWEGLCDTLAETDTRYRRTQVDPIRHNFRLLFDRSLRRDIAAGFIDYWYRSGRINETTRDALSRRRLLLAFHVILSILPLVGRWLQKLIGNAPYRQHLSRFLRDARYRWEILNRQRVSAVKTWIVDGRTTEKRAGKCLGSLPCYFADRFLCGWMPPAWQRFFTDFSYQLDCWRRFFVSPVKYIFVGSYRREVNMNWITQRTREDVKRGFLSPAEAEEYVRIAGHKTIQHYITGLMVVAAVKPTSEIFYVAFGVYLVSLRDSLRHLGWWAVPLAAVVALISPAGIPRFLYSAIAGAFNRDVPYGTAILMAPIRGVGDLSFAAQIAKTHPGFSSYLLTSTTCRLAEHIPVFGEKGGLLSLWVVTVLLSWPASFKTWLAVRSCDSYERRK